MDKIDLVATKAMRFGGHPLQPGDEFQASRRDARTLVAIGKAEERPVAPETVTEPPAPPKPVEPKVQTRSVVAETKPTVSQKRGYKRRDMKAER